MSTRITHALLAGIAMLGMSVGTSYAREGIHDAKPMMNMEPINDILSLTGIVPNWHPMFVHFPIALLITAAGLFVAAALLANKPIGSKLFQAAHYNLWLGTLAVFFTVGTGWYAYQTVFHDEAGHNAMTVHMHWALGTLAISVLAAVAAKFSRRHINRPTALVLILTLLSAGAVAVTGYLGGENVYRNGIGVMRMLNMNEQRPDSEANGHHNHKDGEGRE